MKKIISLLLSLALVVACFVPMVMATQARAEDTAGDSTNTSGMYINKTATYNEATNDYTITLEAYATGEKITTTVSKDKPTDIILVLDQSGSMSNKMGKLAYGEYTANNSQHRNTNTNLYSYRSNGGYDNLWYKLDDDTYVSVSVTRTEIPTKITSGKNNSFSLGATNYWANKDNLYAKVNGQYQKVNVSRTESGTGYFKTYTYTYKVGDVTIATSTGDSEDNITFNTDDGCLYLSSSSDWDKDYSYGYYYTKEDGTVVNIITSEGNKSNVTGFYYQYAATGDSRLQNLKKAVTQFTGEVRKKALGTDGKSGTADDVAFSIAIVGFGSDETGNTRYQNTELFIGSTEYNYNGSQISGQYGKALQDVNTYQGYQNVQNSINALSADGGTAINLGAEMANKILEAYKDDKDHKDREKVIIIFTDGYPGIKDSASDDTRKSYANAAIANTYTAKNTYGATVYTIGVFDGADASDAKNLTTKTNWSDNAVCNKFLHILSSNYLTATSMDNYGTLNPLCKDGTKSYYLSAGDADTLNAIFSKISSEIQTGGSSSTLNSSAVIKDIIAPQFQLPDGATASNITLESYKCTGKEGDGYTWQKNETVMGATATINGDTVDVTGFNFSDNWVGTDTNNGNTTYHGNKLVIKFTVKAKDGFLGGNDVYTNTSAGVYENKDATEPVLTFNRPQVNVPIQNVTVTAADKNVYLLGSLTADQIKSGTTASCGSVNLDLSAENYGLESWQTEYVNISVTYTDKDGNTVTDLKNLKEDTTYTVTVTITPKTDGTSTDQGTKATKQEGSGEGKINVFTPTLTFKDSIVYYGDDAPTDYSNNYESTKTVWKHGETTSTDKGVTMTGDKPDLNLSYNAGTGIVDKKIAVKTDIPVDVTVEIGTTDVTDKTSFNHTDCDGKTCTVPEGKEFLLHVNTCQLTIEKKAGKDTAIGNDEYFVFTIQKDGVAYTQVTIKGTGSVTISELPVGTYTVTEDKNVAWRYTSSMSAEKVILSSANSKGSVTCTNTIEDNKWLNDFTRVINTYGETEGKKD